MSKPDFVYVTYITTTAEKLWDALVNPETTKLYWANHRNASDWQPGSRWEHRDYDDASRVDVVGTVVESDPPKRLVLTWARPAEAENEAKHSRVTFELEPVQDAVRLTVIHDNLASDPDMLRAISGGWPAVLSSLKSLLETGKPLAMMHRCGSR